MSQRSLYFFRNVYTEDNFFQTSQKVSDSLNGVDILREKEEGEFQTTDNMMHIRKITQYHWTTLI